MKTSSTFWSQLQADIQKFSTRAKKNIRNSDKKHKLKNKYHSIDLTDHHTLTKSQYPPHSINRIRDQHRASLDHETGIKNRIHYMAVQRDRRVQSSQQVRQKYQKVLSIRSQSLKEKKLISDELISFQNQYYQMQKSKVMKAQYEKLNIEKSQKRLLHDKFSMANSVRVSTKNNQSTILANREQVLQNKKKSVNSIQLAQQKSAQVLKKLSYRKIELGKKNHQKKVWDEYKKLQLQQRKNNTIIDHFDEKIRQIEEDKGRAQEETKMYRNYLGLNRGRRNPERSRSYRSRQFQLNG